MSILIKGMKLPKCCFECPCYHRKRDVGYYDYELCDVNGTIFNDGYSSVTEHKDKINPFEERLGNCPLVEVLPHGDLIDRDSLIKDGWALIRNTEKVDYLLTETMPLNCPSVPTIIEAEEDD